MCLLTEDPQRRPFSRVCPGGRCCLPCPWLCKQGHPEAFAPVDLPPGQVGVSTPGGSLHSLAAGLGCCGPGAHRDDHLLPQAHALRRVFADQMAFSASATLGFVSGFTKPETCTIRPFAKLTDPALWWSVCDITCSACSVCDVTCSCVPCVMSPAPCVPSDITCSVCSVCDITALHELAH